MVFCLNNCNFDEDPALNRGKCNYDTGECVCEASYSGTDCSIYKTGINNGINMQFIYKTFIIIIIF